MEIDFLKNMI